MLLTLLTILVLVVNGGAAFLVLHLDYNSRIRKSPKIRKRLFYGAMVGVVLATMAGVILAIFDSRERDQLRERVQATLGNLLGEDTIPMVYPDWMAHVPGYIPVEVQATSDQDGGGGHILSGLALRFLESKEWGEGNDEKFLSHPEVNISYLFPGGLGSRTLDKKYWPPLPSPDGGVESYTIEMWTPSARYVETLAFRKSTGPAPWDFFFMVQRIDPFGNRGSSSRVVRGGHWNFGPDTFSPKDEQATASSDAGTASTP